MLKTGMMTINLSIYTDMKTALKTIKDIGFDCADISLNVCGAASTLNPYFSGSDYLKKARELKAYADSIGLPLLQSHAPYPVHRDKKLVYNIKMFRKLKRCIRICGVLGIPNLVIHPWNDWPDEKNVRFYKKLLPLAKKCNVVICCENMWRWDNENDRARPCACSLNDSFVNTVKGVNSPYLKACVDIGHAEMFRFMGISAKSMLETLGQEVACLHIHDNDNVHDSHMIPFKGNIDFEEVAEALRNIGYKNDLITETDPPERVTGRKHTFEEAVLFWKEQLEAVKKLRDMIQSV